MEWKNEHSVGIREIDEQHKKVIEIIARIERAIKSQRGWREIVYDVVDLRVFARSHFEFEEGLMRMYGYQAYEKHAQGHQYFFARLAEIESKATYDVAESELLKFLRDWLREHILQEDRGYAEHILSGASVVRSDAAKQAVVKSGS